MGSLFCNGVVIDYVVIRIFESLPRLRNRLHEAIFSDPKQVAVNLVFGVHSKEAGVLFDLFVLGTSVGSLRAGLVLAKFLLLNVVLTLLLVLGLVAQIHNSNFKLCV